MEYKELLGRRIIGEVCTGPKETPEGQPIPPHEVKIEILYHDRDKGVLHTCANLTPHGMCGILVGYGNKKRQSGISYETEVMQPPCPNSPFGQVSGSGMLIG